MAAWLAAACMVPVACDKPPAPTASTRPAGDSRVSHVPAFTRGHLQTLAVLAPNRPTSIAVLPSGKLFFCQTTPDGRDLVLTIGNREVPEPTALTSSTIADAIGDPLINGNIESLTAGHDGRLWFFFRGSVGEQRQKRTVMAVGSYDVFTTRIRVYADLARLRAATEFGASIELADGDVICGRNLCWIWLRHLDGSALLAIDLSRLPADGPVELLRPFPIVRYGSETLLMNRREYRLSAAGDGTDDLLLVDAYTGGLFRVDPLGRASLMSALIGLPRLLSPAAAMPAPNAGRTLLFAADADPIEPKVESRIDAPSIDSAFPAFLIFEPQRRIAAIAHQQLTGRLGLPVYALRIEELLPEPGGTFLAFDAANGELMRVRLHN